MRSLLRASFGLSFMLFLAGCSAVTALGQDASSVAHLDSGSQRMLASGDNDFAIRAAQGGLAEVRLGKLASEKGSDPAVKAFGQQMVDDHTKANDQLNALARNKNFTLPATLNAKDQAADERLSRLSGAAFDKAYVEDMVKDHEADVKDFRKEAKGGGDPDLKNFASETLPTLQRHLEKIKSIKSKVG